jgi:hypothetical protein
LHGYVHGVSTDRNQEGDSAERAFSTKEGYWEYKCLPFGLKTAPATFQRMMNVILIGLIGSRCFVFHDDIVVYARSLKEHDDMTWKVEMDEKTKATIPYEFHDSPTGGEGAQGNEYVVKCTGKLKNSTSGTT